MYFLFIVYNVTNCFVFYAVVNISFGATSLSVFERNGFVELILTKSDGAVGTVSVNLTTADGTAGL